MKGDNVIYFTVDDVIDKYKNSYWSRSEENYLLSNVLAVEYSNIAKVLKKEYDDVIYKIIKNIKKLSVFMLAVLQIQYSLNTLFLLLPTHCF